MKIKKIFLYSLLTFITSFIFIKVSADIPDTCNSLLRFGDNNECVASLQQTLNEKGICSLTVNGIYDENTYNCVVNLQDKNGLSVDGIVGPATKQLLKNIDSKKGVVTASKLNIRTNAGTNYNSIANKPWYKIKFNSIVGYVDAKYITQTFVVVYLNTQQLELYKNNTLYLSTPVVTGNIGKYETPTGYFKIKYKQTNTYLKGKNADGSTYKSHVNYWMPFNAGIGLHDATWRGNGTNLNYFGNKIYQTNGSHGCINMPYYAAQTVYNNVNAGTVVIVVK